MKDSLTASYKMAECNEVESINREARKLTEKLDIEDRVEELPRRNAFLTLKDHKKDFYANTKCRLINPTKSELG